MLVIYPAIIHVDDDGLWAEFPDLPGCFTQGDTQEELLANAAEAMECFLLGLLEDGEKLAARMDKLTERQKIGEDSVKALQDQLEQERRRGDALQKRLDDMEKVLKAKPVKPGLTAILRQATWGVGIICAAWVIVAILKLIGG